MMVSQNVSIGNVPKISFRAKRRLRIFPACLLLAAPISGLGQGGACSVPFSSPVTLSDSVVGTGSPFLYSTGGNSPNITYVRSGGAPNDISVDVGAVGGGVSTGIGANAQSALGDVTAATLPNGNYLYAYLPYQSSTMSLVQAVTQMGPYSSFTFVSGGPAFQTKLTPSLLSYGGQVYAAYVDTNGKVNITRSSDGHSWSYLGIAPGAATAASRPTLAVFNSSLYVGFVDSGHFAEVGKIITGGVFSPNVVQITSAQVSNSNSGGFFAGLALLQVNSSLLLAAQYVNGTHALVETESSNGTSWTSYGTCSSTQLRWTPSLLAIGSTVYLTYQSDSSNSVISATFN